MCAIEQVKLFLKFVRDSWRIMAASVLLLFVTVGAVVTFVQPQLLRNPRHIINPEGFSRNSVPVQVHGQPTFMKRLSSATGDPCGLKRGLEVPEGCLNKDECTLKPASINYDQCVKQYKQNGLLTDALPPPPLKRFEGGYGNEEEVDDINRIPEYVTPYMFLDRNTSTPLYLILQAGFHNQTIRTERCQEEGASCMLSAKGEGYCAKAVQKYSRTIIDAVNLKTLELCLIDYRFKSGCACQYFSGGECDSDKKDIISNQ